MSEWAEQTEEQEKDRYMRIGNRELKNKGETYIWGILNVTPDSFSDGGTHNTVDRALRATEQMIADGADVIDLGGESTRPGYTLLPEEEEISRILPVIRAIKERFDVPLSVDTYKSAVAESALEEGADCINDIWGLKWDGSMAKVLAGYQVPCCLMHNRREAIYQNLVADVISDLRETLQMAEAAGIEKEKIILDPGIGFAKSFEENKHLIHHMEALEELGCPLLLGTSRKSVIGLALELPVTERLEGTLVTTVLAVLKGYSHIRVHDVKENKRAIAMARAILEA